MQKLKYSGKYDLYRLYMDQDELDLVLALLSNVRLDSNGNRYQHAAFSLLSEAEGKGYIDHNCVNVVCNVVDVDYTSLEVSPNDDR